MFNIIYEDSKRVSTVEGIKKSNTSTCDDNNNEVKQVIITIIYNVMWL